MFPFTKSPGSVLSLQQICWLSILPLFAGSSVTAEPAHPSLLFSQEDLPALREKIKSGWIKNIYDSMKAKADSYLTLSTDPYINYRSAGGGRTMHFHAATLAMTGLLSGEQKYLDKATSIVMSVVQKTNVDDFVALNDHLAVGDAAHTYAILYDWLYPYLTPEQRSILRNEMIEFGSWLYNYSMAEQYYGRYEPIPLSCNHSSVLHGGMGLCAFVLGDRPDWVERASKYIIGYFKYSMDATGYSYEGIGYFGYGYLGAVPFCLALKRFGGDDLVRADAKNALLANHILHQTAPWGKEVIALNDSGERLANSSGLMYLISTYQDRVGLWAWLRMFGPDGDGTYGSELMGSDAATQAYLLIFADPSLEPLSPVEGNVPNNIIYDSGRASYRTGWSDLDAMATFTSGFDQHRGHNHKDENSFTFYSRGEKFVIDPTYQPSTTRSHNTLLIDGQGQMRDPDEYDVYGKVIGTQDFGVAWAIKGEAAEAFPSSLGVAKAQRQFLFASGNTPYIVVADDYEKTSQTVADYTWLLHTDKNNTITLDANGLGTTIRGNKRNALCRIQFLNPVEGLTLSESDLSTETFVAREKTHHCRDYFKEIQASARALNPRFVAVITAADTIEEFPTISADGPADNMTIELKWPNKDTDRIQITAGKFQFQRGASAAGNFKKH